MSESASQAKLRRLNVLLVDDDDADIVLVERAFVQEQRCVPNIHVAKDGLEAMWFLRRQGEFAVAPRPDLILLGLSTPRKNGREVLGEIKRDPHLRAIPVVVLTATSSDADVARLYELQANCCVTKPISTEQFTRMIQEIQQFWCTVAHLPPMISESTANFSTPVDGLISPIS